MRAEEGTGRRGPSNSIEGLKEGSLEGLRLIQMKVRSDA